MAVQEKSDFFQLLASLFHIPDQEMVRQIHSGAVYSFFHEHLRRWGENLDLIKGLLMERDPGALLKELRGAYESLFSGLRGGVSLWSNPIINLGP